MRDSNSQRYRFESVMRHKILIMKEIIKALPTVVGITTIILFVVIVGTAIKNPSMYKLPPVDTTNQHYVKSPMQIPVKK